MLSDKSYFPVVGSEYKLINYRTVSTLCAAEFIHDLYNRHDPQINSIRFRETLCVYKDGSLFSFALKRDWDRLAKWFGHRLLVPDSPLYHAIERYAAREHKETDLLVQRLSATDVAGLDNWGLAEALLDVHYIPLGDIYRLNLVQIEHALGCVLTEELTKLYGAGQCDVILAAELGALRDTTARSEDMAFRLLVLEGRQAGVADPHVQSDVDAKQVLSKLREHLEVWGGVFRGYGAEPSTLFELTQRYMLTEFDSRQTHEEPAHFDLPATLKSQISLLKAVGQLRDSNKALLGRVMSWRNVLMTEIARRSGTNSVDLRLYTLSDLCDLAVDGVLVSGDLLDQRRSGVTVRRSEGIFSGVADWPEAPREAPAKLTGTCASRGNHVGAVRIVRSSVDAAQVKPGEVLVAPGTDFDLMVGMQRAGAIVTEEGGILSHAAVVAREYKIPCVVAVDLATRKLRSGDIVRVDADAGQITHWGEK